MKDLIASIPVPAKMYRHFATVTIVITACIALFADGERREAIGAEIKADQQRQEMRALDAQRNGPAKVGADRQFHSGGGWGSESGVSGEAGLVNPDQSGDAAPSTTHYRPVGQDMSSRPPGYFDPATGLPKAGQIAPPRPTAVKKVTPTDMERLREAGESRAGPATQAGA